MHMIIRDPELNGFRSRVVDIAEEIGLSARTINRVVASLKASNIIHISKLKGDLGPEDRNIYHINRRYYGPEIQQS